MQKSGAQYRQLADNEFKKYKRTLEEEETAIYYYNLAIQSGSLHGIQLSECYRNIGEIYRDRVPKTKENYDQALAHFQKATTIQGLPSWFCVENQTERLAMIPEGAGFDPAWRNAELGKAMHALAIKRQNGGDLAITSQDWLAHGLYHTNIIRSDNLKAAFDYVDHAIERGWDQLWTSVNYTTYGRVYKYHAERTKESFNNAIEWFQKSIDMNVNAMQSNQPWSIIGRGTARAIFELADLLYEPERFGFSSSLKDKSRGRKLFDQGKEHIAKYGTVGPHSIIESMYVNVFDKAMIYSRTVKDFPMVKELCDLGKKISKNPGDSSVFYLYQAVAFHSVGNKSVDTFKSIADNYYHCLMEHKNAKPSEMWKAKHAVKWATPLAMDCLAEGFPAKCKKTKESQRLVDILNQILTNPNGYNCNHEVTNILEVCSRLYGELHELTKEAESSFSGAYQLLAGGFKSLISKVSNYIGNAIKHFDEPSTVEKVKQKHQEETENIRKKMEFVRQQTLNARNTIFKTSKYDSLWSDDLKRQIDAEIAHFVEKNKDSSSFVSDAAVHGVKLLTKLVESYKDQDKFNLNEVEASIYLSMLFNLGDDYFPTDLDKFLSTIGSDKTVPKSRANLDESIDDQEAEFMNFVAPKLNELFNKVNTSKGVSGFEHVQEYELEDEVKEFHKTYRHEDAANFEESFVKVGNLYKTCQSRYQDFQNRFENLNGDMRCETSLKSYFRVVQKHRELAYDEDFNFKPDAHNRVWDILRCTYYVELNDASKVQKIISDLEDQGCRVIRMKNKMNTHLQNFTINFMWGDIVCEAQICFGKDTKNSQFVHLIYELQRCKNFCELYLTLLNGDAVVDYCNYLKSKGEGEEVIEEVKKANEFIVNISDQLSALEQMFL